MGWGSNSSTLEAPWTKQGLGSTFQSTDRHHPHVPCQVWDDHQPGSRWTDPAGSHWGAEWRVKWLSCYKKIYNLTAIHQSNKCFTTPFHQKKGLLASKGNLCSQLFYLKNKIPHKKQIFGVCSTCISTHSLGSQMEFDNLHTGVFHFHMLDFLPAWN